MTRPCPETDYRPIPINTLLRWCRVLVDAGKTDEAERLRREITDQDERIAA